MVRFFYNTKKGWETFIEQVSDLYKEGFIMFEPSVEGKFPDQTLSLKLHKGRELIYPPLDENEKKWRRDVGYPVDKYVTVTVSYDVFKHAVIAVPDMKDNPASIKICVNDKDKNILASFVGNLVELSEVEDIKLRRWKLEIKEMDKSLGVVHVKKKETRFYNTRDAAMEAMSALISQSEQASVGNMLRLVGEGAPANISLSKRDNDYILTLPDGITKVFTPTPADVEDR